MSDRPTNPVDPVTITGPGDAAIGGASNETGIPHGMPVRVRACRYGQVAGTVAVTVTTVRPSVMPMPTLVGLLPVFARVIVTELPLAIAVTAALVEVAEKPPPPPMTVTEPDSPQPSVIVVGPTARVTGAGGVIVPGSVDTVTVVRPPRASVMMIAPSLMHVFGLVAVNVKRPGLVSDWVGVTTMLGKELTAV
jgi:hypothetical protein